MAKRRWLLTAVIIALVAALFLFSGGQHLKNPYGFLTSVRGYQMLGDRTSVWAALLIPILEITIGSLLLQRSTRYHAFLAASVLAFLFFGAQAYVLFLGLDIGCGCFGNGFERQVSAKTAGFTLALCSVCLFGAVLCSQNALSSSSDSSGKWGLRRSLKTIGRSGRPPQHCGNRAFTVVELLVVVLIGGILLSLALMAVQAARAASRRVQCLNNLRQIAIAAENHHATAGHFPTGGWGGGWMGVASRGYGREQPGGWFYNILPFSEQQHIHDIVSADPTNFADRSAVEQMAVEMPEFLSCPEREDSWAILDISIPYYGLHRIRKGRMSDYSVNSGSRAYLAEFGPPDFESSKTHRWPNASEINGVCWFRSTVRSRDLSDGASHTLLVGEKWVAVDRSEEVGFDQPAWTGDSADVHRFTQNPPRPDRIMHDSALAFGSSHDMGIHVAFCDGATRMISYTIDPLIFRDLGSRNDGRVHSLE